MTNHLPTTPHTVSAPPNLASFIALTPPLTPARLTALAPLLTLALIIALAASSPTALAQQTPLSVVGQVVNPTSAAGSLDGLPVTLHMQGVEIYNSMDTTTDTDGSFRFDGITFEPSIIYAVSVRYQDALYGTEITLTPGEPPQQTTIHVYDAVRDAQVLRVGSASLLFADADRTTQTITAMEIIKVINDSDYTFVPGSGGPMNLLRFGLPPDFQSLQVDTRLLGADIVQVDRGFAVIGSVPPGTHDIMFTYTFPYEDSEATFTKSFPFGADNLRVLSPEQAMKLGSSDIGSPQPVSIGERPYQLIEASQIQRGDRISLSLSALPRTTLADSIQNTLNSMRYEYAAPALLAIFTTLLLIYAIIRRRKSINAST